MARHRPRETGSGLNGHQRRMEFFGRKPSRTESDGPRADMDATRFSEAPLAEDPLIKPWAALPSNTITDEPTEDEIMDDINGGGLDNPAQFAS